MRKITDIIELHKLAINIAKAFHDVCVRNDIPYYMLYGTMLGAKRHQGFIPWDDDMDFGIELKYYEKIVNSLKKDLPKRYRLLTRCDRQGAIGGFLKIEDTQTIVYEKSRIHEEENTGVFIDVFILYPCNANKSWWSRSGLIKFFTLIQAYRFCSMNGRGWKKIFSYVTKILFCGLKRDSLINFYEKYLVVKEGRFFTTYSSVYNMKDIIDRNIYGQPLLYKFEDAVFYGVEDSDAYLSHLYGDYMKQPPLEKRKVHASEVYYK